MKILLIGDSAREHAMAEALAKNSEVYSIMKKKNPGIVKHSAGYKVIKKIGSELIEELVNKWEIDFFVAGAGAYEWNDFVESLGHCKSPYSGPSAEASKIGTDQSFLRELMQRNETTGRITYQIFDNADDAAEFIDVYGMAVVVKPIEEGKKIKLVSEGRGQLKDLEAAKKYAKELIGKEGKRVVIEEMLQGEEFTIQGFADGKYLAPLPAVHEPRFSQGIRKGQLTPGMGSYSSGKNILPFMENVDYDAAVAVMQELVTAMDEEGRGYHGAISARFILTETGPRLIDVMIGLSDPGAVSLLPLFKTNYCEVCEAMIEGELENMKIELEPKATVCKYLVPKGYPSKPATGKINLKTDEGVYYNAIDIKKDQLYTAGERSIVFRGEGDSIEGAEELVEKNISKTTGKVSYREDIGKEESIAQQTEAMHNLRGEAKEA